MSLLASTPNEKKSLAAHVDLCALRYSNLESRLTQIEVKLDKFEAKLDSFKTEITWLLIKGAGGIIVLLLSVIGAISKAAGIW
jgi:dethiobiotin synthetase